LESMLLIVPTAGVVRAGAVTCGSACDTRLNVAKDPAQQNAARPTAAKE
jgi:predicted lysophospholipase L1 biosynthesis ABC-type transport system permease subunit